MSQEFTSPLTFCTVRGREVLPLPVQGGPLGPPDPEAAREIELAIDAVRQRSPYDLPVCPQYMFDPDYTPDHVLLILGWPMHETPLGPGPNI